MIYLIECYTIWWLPCTLLDISVWVWSYDHILRYCKLYWPGSIVVRDIMKTVFATCGKTDSFLTHLSTKVAKINFYVTCWVCVTRSFQNIKKTIFFFIIIRSLCGRLTINYTVIKRFPLIFKVQILGVINLIYTYNWYTNGDVSYKESKFVPVPKHNGTKAYWMFGGKNSGILLFSIRGKWVVIFMHPLHS